MILSFHIYVGSTGSSGCAASTLCSVLSPVSLTSTRAVSCVETIIQLVAQDLYLPNSWYFRFVLKCLAYIFVLFSNNLFLGANYLHHLSTSPFFPGWCPLLCHLFQVVARNVPPHWRPSLQHKNLWGTHSNHTQTIEVRLFDRFWMSNNKGINQRHRMFLWLKKHWGIVLMGIGF